MMSEEMRSQQIEQKQIEEMAKVIIDRNKLNEFSSCKTCVDEKCSFLCYQYCKIYDECSILCVAGYRKQSEVVKEFVAGVTVELNKRRDSELYGKDSILGIINKVAAEYGVEVEK